MIGARQVCSALISAATKGFDFNIRIQLGAGAYICGEESALLESLEGKRGAPRDRPPFPTDHGYLQQPTAVDNVETYVCATRILEQGADWFTKYGTPESTGTKLLSVSGDCSRPGVYELEFGVTVNELLDLVGAPEAVFVQVGGPSGQSVAPKDFGRRIAFEDLATGGSMMVFGPDRDVLDIALQFTDFFVSESCGWCTPCRVGTTLLSKQLRKDHCASRHAFGCRGYGEISQHSNAYEPVWTRTVGCKSDSHHYPKFSAGCMRQGSCRRRLCLA